MAAWKDKQVVSALVEEMRRRRIVIPGISVVERLAAQACTEAEEALFAAVAGRLTPDMVIRLEALIGSGPRARQSGVSWLREPPGKAGAMEMRGLIDRLDAVRHVGVSAEMLDVVPAHRIRRLAQEGRRLTAQNLEQMRPRRRHVTLAAFLLEMEMALTDAAIGMFETLAGKTVRRAQSARDLRLQEEAESVANVLGFFASLGAALGTAHKTGHPLDQAVAALTTWEELAQATASAAALSGNGRSDNLLPFLRAEHARVRGFAAPFLAAFAFEGSGRNAALVDAVDQLSQAWGSGKRSANQPWMRKAMRLADRQWRRAILTADRQIDRKMLDLFLVLELKAEPWHTSRELLERLQARHPGVYPDGQLRTLQRRLKEWRRAAAHQMVFGTMTADLGVAPGDGSLLSNTTNGQLSDETGARSPVDLPLRLDDAGASPTTPQGQHQ